MHFYNKGEVRDDSFHPFYSYVPIKCNQCNNDTGLYERKYLLLNAFKIEDFKGQTSICKDCIHRRISKKKSIFPTLLQGMGL